MPEDKKLKKYILLASIILFVCSLTQKSYCTTANCGDSIMVFLLGWAAFSSGAAGFVWLANPLLLLSWFTIHKNLKTAMFFSVCAALLSLSFLLFSSIADSGGRAAHRIISYKAGYWLWVGSCVCMQVGTFILMLRYNTRKG